MQILSESGIEAVTMTSVSKRAGLSRASLYEYVPSTTSVRELALQQLMQAPADESTLSAQGRVLVDAISTCVAAGTVDPQTAATFTAAGLAAVQRVSKA